MDKIKTSIIALTVAFTACGLDATDGQVDPPARSSCVTDVSTHETTCFDTFTAAIAMATDGRITDAPDDPRAYATDAALRARIDGVASGGGAQPAVSAVLGVIYKDANFGGDPAVYRGSHACSPVFNAAPEYEFAVMPAGFNDEVSSFTTANNCFMVLYAEGGCTGRTTDVNHAREEAYVGDAMNDKASCVRFF
jgi:hypothetical protein